MDYCNDMILRSQYEENENQLAFDNVKWWYKDWGIIMWRSCWLYFVLSEIATWGPSQ